MLAVSDCLVVGILHFFGQFRGQRKVLALVKIHQVRNYFPKKIMFYYQKFFSFSNMFFIRLSLANARKKIGCHPACFLTNCRERWTKFSDRSQDREFARLRLGRDTKQRPSCSKFALDIKLVFSCFYVFDIANT